MQRVKDLEKECWTQEMTHTPQINNLMDSHILLSYIPRELFSYHDKHHHPAVEFYQGEHVIDFDHCVDC